MFSVDGDDEFKEKNGKVVKMILSSSVGVSGRVSIDVVIVVPSIISGVVVVGVGVVGLWGAALSPMMLVFSVAGTFGSSA